MSLKEREREEINKPPYLFLSILRQEKKYKHSGVKRRGMAAVQQGGDNTAAVAAATGKEAAGNKSYVHVRENSDKELQNLFDFALNKVLDGSKVSWLVVGWLGDWVVR